MYLLSGKGANIQQATFEVVLSSVLRIKISRSCCVVCFLNLVVCYGICYFPM